MIILWFKNVNITISNEWVTAGKRIGGGYHDIRLKSIPNTYTAQIHKIDTNSFFFGKISIYQE